MIEISDIAASIMSGQSGGYEMFTRVESWRAGELLDGDIPVASGSVTTDVTLSVPESLTMTVPAYDRGVSYVPGADQDHPLACWGQRLHVSLGVGIGRDMVEWLGREWLYITDAKPDGADGVTVTASGLLGLIQEAPFVAPVAPICSGNQQTFAQVLLRFVEPAFHVDFTNAPDDRLIPVGTIWDDGRLDSINELLTMWPADAYIDTDGILQVIAVADTSVPSLALSDGLRGTAMAWGSEVTRDGSSSAVVARGTDANGLDVQGVAYDKDPKSPTMYGGPFNPLPVPYIYSSALLTTAAQCTASAAATLALRKRQAARRIDTTAVPHLALQTRDGVTVTAGRLGVVGELGIVDKVTMPLTATDGGMAVGVRLI